MTNYDRALHILEAARRPGDLRIHPHDAVEALAQAGLLMPDLPEEDFVTEKGTHVWMPKQGFTVTAYHDGEIRMGIPPAYPDTELREVIYTQQIATEQALDLLAAAQYAKEQA